MTANEQFYADSLTKRAKFLNELADTARSAYAAAQDAYASFKGSDEQLAELRGEMKKLETLFAEANAAAYNAEVRASYYLRK